MIRIVSDKISIISLNVFLLSTKANQKSIWKFSKAIALCGIILFPLLGFSQEMRFDHLAVKQGLSQGNVTDILQDKFGFMWIGTEDGLNFYDGYKITVFRNNPDDSTSISSNSIVCIVQDDQGNLWIGTTKGLNFYNRRTNIFERIPSNPNDPTSLTGNSVSGIHIDPKKRLWVGAAGNLHVYDSTKKAFKRFAPDPNNPTSTLLIGSVESMITDSQNRLWVGVNEGGISMLNADGKSFTNYTNDPSNPSSLNDNSVKCLFEDKENGIWVTTSLGGLSLLNTDNGTFTSFTHNPDDPSSIASQLIRSVTADRHGQLWVSTDASLDLMNIKEGTFKHFFNDPSNEKSINSNTVVKVIFDANDRMWLGTRNGGINIYDKDRYSFELYKHNPQNNNSLANNNTTSFSEDSKGNIWVGTDGGGASYFDRKSGRFTSLSSDPKNSNSLTNNKVLAVQTDDEGGVWLGMWDGGVNYYNPVTKRIKHYMPEPNNPKSISDTRFFNIYKDRKGTIWFGAFENGLCRYNKDTDDFTRYLSILNDPTSIAPASINEILEDHLGNIWVGSQGGLNMLDQGKGTFTRFTTGAEDGISSNGVLSLLLDHQNRLWVGTDAGLNLFDYETKTFKVYKKRDGLPNDVIIGILEDKSHNLWLSTNQGLCRFNADSLSFKFYDDSYGLQDNQFNKWAYTALSSGELVFGGANGFNIFNPQNIRDNPYKPEVYITDIKLFNKPVAIGKDEVLKQSIMLTKEMSLRHFQNFFTFEFTALNFRQTEKNQYKYILEGFDEDWIDAGAERRAAYTNIGPGEYVFKVIASNNDGVWNMEGASIRITIVPPFWRTWWFIAFILIGATTGIIGTIRYQRNKTIRQKEELKAVIEEQTREVKKQNEEILKKTEQEKIQNWIIKGLAHFGDIMSKHKGNLEELSDQILTNLVQYVDAKQGCLAIAVTEEEANVEYLKIMSTYAVDKERLKAIRIDVGEGLIGATFKDKEKKYLTNIPGNYSIIESGLGMVKSPRLLLLPLKTDTEIFGVIELAFFDDVSDVVHEFLDKLANIIALNINAANLNYKTQILLQQSKEQTEELRAQEEEMRQNMEELEATQEEQRRREESMQQKITEIDALQKEFNRKEQEYLRKIQEYKTKLSTD